MVRFATLGILAVVVGVVAVTVLAQEPEEAAGIGSTAISTPSSGKRRLGGVIKYKKVSVKLNSADASGGETVVSFVHGNKTRRIKPKTSPQTMIYKPSKGNKLFSPALLSTEEEGPNIRHPGEPNADTTATTTTTTTTTSTTEAPKIRIFTSTTEDPEASFSPAASGFVRPTARSRVRVIKRPTGSQVLPEDDDKPNKSPVRTVTRIPGLRPAPRSTTTSTSTTTEASTTAKFIRPTRRPYTGTRTSTEQVIHVQHKPESSTSIPVASDDSDGVKESAQDPPDNVENSQEEPLIPEGPKGAAPDVEGRPSSSAPFRRTTTEIPALRRPTTSAPKQPPTKEEDETEDLRVKLETEKTKQLERLRLIRPQPKRPENPPEETPKERFVPSEPVDENSPLEDLVAFVRPPPSNYGQRLPDQPKYKAPAGNTPSEPSDPPKLVYTPPVYEYQAPAGYLTGGYLPHVRPSPIPHHYNVRLPPVTYEPPHEEYRPPAPSPPPRIYEPPREEYRPPAQLFHDGYQRRPDEGRVIHESFRAREPYSRLVAVGQPAVNELPYPPAVEGPSQDLQNSYRPSEREKSQKDEDTFQPVIRVKETVYVAYDPEPSEKPELLGHKPNFLTTKRPENDHNHSEKTFLHNNIRIPVSEQPRVVYTTHSPDTSIRLDTKPFEQPVKLFVGNYGHNDDKVQTAIRMHQQRPYEPTEEPRTVHEKKPTISPKPAVTIIHAKPYDSFGKPIPSTEGPRTKLVKEQFLESVYRDESPFRHPSVSSQSTFAEEPRVPYAQPHSEPPSHHYNIKPYVIASESPYHSKADGFRVVQPTYRPYVVIEKPITVTVRPHGEPPSSSDWKPRLPGIETNAYRSTYASKPFHHGGRSHHNAPAFSPAPVRIETFEKEASWTVDPVDLNQFHRPSKLEVAPSHNNYLRQNRSLASIPPESGNEALDDNPDQQIDGAVKGVPGVDYPVLTSIPNDLTFNCDAMESPGYYADPDTRCQVFHVCQTNRDRNSFLCPNGTIFNQKVRVCDWWHNVKCGESAAFYHVNSDLNESSEPSSLYYENPGR